MAGRKVVRSIMMNEVEIKAAAFYSTDFIRKALGVHYRTVLALIRRGRFKAAKYGKAYQISGASVIADLMRQCR